MKEKLGVVVPYRHRERQLPIFIDEMSEYLKKQDIPFEIIIVEQDDAKQFNRGMLLNIGFTYAKKYGCRYVVFHDIDMIPVDVDYSYSDIPLHLATNFIDETEDIFDEYFGGVTMFTIRDFIKINGFSNKYWDWGYEDTDLLRRVKKQGLSLDDLKVKNVGALNKPSLQFNGNKSYVRGKLDFDITKGNFSFFVSFSPEDIFCDPTKDVDTYTVFSIPGYDTSISFNSFSRYNFLSFDKDDKSIYIDSKIKPNYKTNILVTLDNNNKLIEMYQDGVKIGDAFFETELRPYYDQRYFFLGVGKPNRKGDERYFKGTIDTFALFQHVLNDEEIKDVSLNGNIADKRPLIHYDTSEMDNHLLKDLSGNGNDGNINNCYIVTPNLNEYKVVKIPHRRKSVFRTLSHEKNGYVDNGWKNKATRWNQLRYHNEVYLNDDLLRNDGLSDLSFMEHGVNRINNNTTIITIGV
jgi:beta-1,4-galactosyltransferase 1